MREIDKVSHAGNIIYSVIFLFRLFFSVGLVKNLYFLQILTLEKNNLSEKERKMGCFQGTESEDEQKAENSLYKCTVVLVLFLQGPVCFICDRLVWFS